MGCLNCTCGSVVIQQRYVACTMAFLAIVSSYTMRVSLNLAITQIVQADGKAVAQSECNVTSAPIADEHEEKYEWAPEQVATILTAFFYGYVPAHIPGGFLSDVYGAKSVLIVDVIVSAIATLLTPTSITMGNWKFLCVLRVLMGIVQGALFPAAATLLAKWVPRSERGRAGTWVFTGAQVGSILGNLVSGFIMGYMKSWKAVFYFWGIASVIWIVGAQFFLYSEPAHHPRITEAEKEMLMREIGLSEKLSVPWIAMLTDSASIACIVGWWGHSIKFYYINTNLPLYIKDVLKFNVLENGVFNAIAYAVLWIFASISAIFCDMSINRNWMSLLTSRRVYTLAGNVLPAIALLGTGFVGCHRNWAITTIILSTALQAPVYCSVRVNVLDLTKNYAGILTAFVNGIGALVYCPIPYLIAVIAGDNKIKNWCKIFGIIAGASCFCTIIYLIWAKGERRDWDKVE